MQCVYSIFLLKFNESKRKTNKKNNNDCVDKLRTTSESYRNNMKASDVQKIVYKFVYQANKDMTKARRVINLLSCQWSSRLGNEQGE